MLSDYFRLCHAPHAFTHGKKQNKMDHTCEFAHVSRHKHAHTCTQKHKYHILPANLSYLVARIINDTRLALPDEVVRGALLHFNMQNLN